MCGVWASVGLAVERSRISRVAHRGPDGEGWNTFDCPWGPVALGHRRLAIIDTSANANQPMCDAGARYWLTFNGEIYNYLELRRALIDVGVTFRTNSDSEVLLAAYIHWGESCLDRLLGMFAFAIWDDTAKSLFLARDRFGIKPLYIAVRPDGIAAASEIKQLYDLADMPRTMNLARVYDFLGFGLSDHTTETMFSGIQQLHAGGCLTIATDGATPGTMPPPRLWYTLPRPGQSAITRDAATDAYRHLFDDAVRLHLRSDVAVGSCLSGGLDSSSIVCTAARQLGSDAFAGRFTAISAVYGEARVDERSYINAVLGATHAKPCFVTPSPADIERDIEAMIWHQDEPFGSTSICAQWAVFAAARAAGIKVMLDGQGADEPLAGYHWLFGPALAALIRGGRWREAAAMLAERKVAHGASYASQMLRATPFLIPDRWRGTAYALRRGRGGVDWLAGAAFAPYAHDPDPLQAVAAAYSLAGCTDIGSMCWLTTAATSLPMLLHWEDRSSMAHGIEARVPFLDHRLVDYAMALGAQHKIEGAQTKVVLRRAMADRLPLPVLHRQDKIGFATPEQEWVRGPLREFMRSGVIATLDTYPHLLNRAATLRMVDAMLSGKRTFDASAWRILMIGIWGQRFGLTM